MSLDKNIRENIDGKYLTIYADDFLEGIEFARQIKISQIQFVNMSNDILIDFINIEKLSEYLQVISFVGIWENISNLNSTSKSSAFFIISSYNALFFSFIWDVNIGGEFYSRMPFL